MKDNNKHKCQDDQTKKKKTKNEKTWQDDRQTKNVKKRKKNKKITHKHKSI